MVLARAQDRGGGRDRDSYRGRDSYERRDRSPDRRDRDRLSTIYYIEMQYNNDLTLSLLVTESGLEIA